MKWAHLFSVGVLAIASSFAQAASVTIASDPSSAGTARGLEIQGSNGFNTLNVLENNSSLDGFFTGELALPTEPDAFKAAQTSTVLTGPQSLTVVANGSAAFARPVTVNETLVSESRSFVHIEFTIDSPFTFETTGFLGSSGPGVAGATLTLRKNDSEFIVNENNKGNFAHKGVLSAGLYSLDVNANAADGAGFGESNFDLTFNVNAVPIPLPAAVYPGAILIGAIALRKWRAVR